ncbi:hypothetical protein RLIN73S_06476 [Rhodanobacter lindaniclasticus]
MPRPSSPPRPRRPAAAPPGPPRRTSARPPRRAPPRPPRRAPRTPVRSYQHVGIVAALLQPGGHGDHRALDDVGRAALHRRVHRGVLGALAQAGVARGEVLQVQPAAEDRFHVAVAAGAFAGRFHERVHAGVAGEVARHVVAGLGAVHAELARQAERAHAVHQAEVDRLGGAALVRADLLRLEAEHLGGGGAVHVAAFVERLEQAFVAGQVGHDAQFDLRIVRRHHLPARRRDERLADAPAFLGAHRDVLQVRVG